VVIYAGTNYSRGVLADVDYDDWYIYAAVEMEDADFGVGLCVLSDNDQTWTNMGRGLFWDASHVVEAFAFDIVNADPDTDYAFIYVLWDDTLIQFARFSLPVDSLSPVETGHIDSTGWRKYEMEAFADDDEYPGNWWPLLFYSVNFNDVIDSSGFWRATRPGTD
jgi:hypothetical protein